MSSEEGIKPSSRWSVVETKRFASFMILNSSPVVTNMIVTGGLHGR